MEHHSTKRQDRIRYLFYSALALILALVIIASFNAQHPAPPSDWQPMPDPPMIDNSWEINIGSKNQVCIGWRDIC